MEKIIHLSRYVVWLLLVFQASGLRAGNSKSIEYKRTWEANDSLLFQVGEELTYNVSYAFIDIGQVRIKIVDKFQENGYTLYSAIAYIDSYKGVPFVDLHTIYESKISPPLCSDWFRARTKDENKWWHITYEMDYDKRSMDIKQGEFGTEAISKQQTLVLDTFFQDGLSLFFFARSRVRYKHTVTIPTIIQEQKVNTFLNFMNERTSEEIDAVDYPIDVVHFDGRADFVGIFGMTGEFEGWFSNDEARVPILAKMKVLIGNVRIELMKWKRAGWNPPRGEDD
ncbi:MAG: DUF3108 domain-containing protein [Ignavibacteriae bacterium]|nr:DUF3108 domain-containing protein [Ignavibacteriota bacterium]